MHMTERKQETDECYRFTGKNSCTSESYMLSNRILCLVPRLTLRKEKSSLFRSLGTTLLNDLNPNICGHCA